MVSKVVVKAPCSTANLGPGFDVFGLALDAYYDTVTLSKGGKGIRIQSFDSIPLSVDNNTAGIVIKQMAKKFKKDGIIVKIKKGVPVGFGLGSSAASAAAAALGFNSLFNLRLDSNTLVKYAGMGEKASAGSIHYDNAAASLLGGFVVVTTDPLNVLHLIPPKDLVLCIAIPMIPVPPKKTQLSRSVLPSKVKISATVRNVSNAAAIVVGILKKDSVLIGNSIKDEIVEPARQHLIPGFAKVKKNALQAGALGVTISGAGPAVIAFATSKSNSKKICKAMEKGFASAKTECHTVICKPSKGATVI